MFRTKPLIIVYYLLSLSAVINFAFDDHDHFTETPEIIRHERGPLPKDKVLLKDVKTLSFHRHKKTTSRRTHSIHQLSCVGGTAGCKLFTPQVVECENIGFDSDKSKFNWRCHADISDRVFFNHVEVICEGYDYPEDDYILLGSCGLEFTLDYKDPLDHHEKSYHSLMDDHEKELHRKKAAATSKPIQAVNKQTFGYMLLIEQLVNNLTNHAFLFGILTLIVIFYFILVRVFSSGASTSNKSASLRGSSYGHLTTAVLTTKKAC